MTLFREFSATGWFRLGGWDSHLPEDDYLDGKRRLHVHVGGLLDTEHKAAGDAIAKAGAFLEILEVLKKAWPTSDLCTSLSERIG